MIPWHEQQRQRSAYEALTRAAHDVGALRQVCAANSDLFFGKPMSFIAEACVAPTEKAEHAQVLCLGRALVALSFMHNVRAEEVVSTFRVFRFAVEWFETHLRIHRESEAAIVAGLLREVRVALRTFDADALGVVPPYCRHIHGLVSEGRDCSDRELFLDIRNI